jgi:hypothetical protein
MRFMIKMLVGSILAKKREILSMDKESISLSKVGLFIKVNGEITKCKERGNPISKKAVWSTQENGSQTNTMVGEFYSRIHH